MTNKVGVLVVLYNQSFEKVRPLLFSLNQQIFKSFKLYVINNGENQISLNKNLTYNFSLLPSRGNIGFARANNILAQEAIRDGCNYLFILNPDMELEKNSILVLYQIMEKYPDVAACSSVVLYGNEMKNDHIIQLFGQAINFKSQHKKFYYSLQKLTDVNLPTLQQVDFVNGGSLFIRSDIVTEVGLFNEKYFMYNDEIDLALKIKKSGYKVMVTSKTRIWHHHDWSKKNITSYKFMYYYMMRNKILYFKKFKLYPYLMFDLILQVFTFPLKVKMFHKIGSLSILKYYYLGLLKGILGETGEAKIIIK